MFINSVLKYRVIQYLNYATHNFKKYFTLKIVERKCWYFRKSNNKRSCFRRNIANKYKVYISYSDHKLQLIFVMKTTVGWPVAHWSRSWEVGTFLTHRFHSLKPNDRLTPNQPRLLKFCFLLRLIFLLLTGLILFYFIYM